MINLSICLLILAACNAVTAAAGASWSVPLYLWRCTTHSALAPNVPASYLATAGNYSLVYPEPVAFASDMSGEEEVSHPLVSLKLYYSEVRDDMQTTTWSLAQLNAHGGQYTYLATLGALAVSPGSGYAAAKFVPLTVSYNDATTDALTAPFIAKDVNALLTEVGLGGYRAGCALTGFAARGTCAACSVGMSETFPSEGGADCAFACNVGTTGQTNFDTTFELGDMKTAASAALKKSMLAADDVILSFGHKDVIATPRTHGTHIHMSFNYFCCYSEEDLKTIHEVLTAYDWPTQLEVSFDQPTIRIDSGADKVEHYSYILLLDEASQAKMHSVMDGVEAAVRAAGVDVHVPRRLQEPFHSTLAVVDGRNFPAVAALEAVNAAVPPGTWSGQAGPLVLSTPTWIK